MLNDALRSLRRAPFFSLTAMSILAVGIGGILTNVHVYRWPGHGRATKEALVALLLGIVLSAVCANVAGLHLARGAGRRREMEIRFALGADTTRIARQLMIENLLLAIGGGMGAIAFAELSASVLASWTNIAGAFVRTDLPLVLLATILTAICWASSGIVPALRLARRRRARSPRRRRTLIGLNACAGCFCLIVGGVYTQWVHYLRYPPMRIPFERTFEIHPASPADLHTTLDRVRRNPVVEAATISGLSLSSGMSYRWLDTRQELGINGVDPSYFDFMGVKLLRGRLFQPGDSYPLILGETAARNLFHGRVPIGQMLRLHWWDRSSALFTVIGIVQDTRESEVSPHDPTFAGEAFTTLDAGALGHAVVLVRTRPGADKHLDAAAVPLPRIMARRQSYAILYAALFDFMGITVALVSTLGVAGILCCAVVQRARDMAIRVALGARLRDIIRVLIAEFLLPMSIGIGAGVFLGANFWLYGGQYLKGVTRFDPATYLGTVGLFATIALIGATIAGTCVWRLPPAKFL